VVLFVCVFLALECLTSTVQSCALKTQSKKLSEEGVSVNDKNSKDSPGLFLCSQKEQDQLVPQVAQHTLSLWAINYVQHLKRRSMKDPVLAIANCYSQKTKSLSSLDITYKSFTHSATCGRVGVWLFYCVPWILHLSFIFWDWQPTMTHSYDSDDRKIE
jgi:hypothetical protein